ncbi:ATP-binding protein [Bacteroides sp. GM023]|uniref:ATP-binding protein n=1 Tax=Bacteroides sp. GM023 TaxID=2723058 RepID=UPI00168B1919|nr:ATP-binding protein [Bacteroides sp. GM023]MBD3588425.1 response regulator [Bacteroides sp. GM023]
MIRYFFFVIVLFLVSYISSFAENSSILWYKQADLNFHNIVDIETTSEGFAWIATHMGLYKYDGCELERQPDIEYEINSICLESGGDLYFCSGRDLYLYNPIHCTAELLRRLPLPAGQKVNVIYEDSDKKLWIGTSDGLFLYSPLSKKKELMKLELPGMTNDTPTIIRTIYQDCKKTLWIGTFDGIYFIDEKLQISRMLSQESSTFGPKNNLTLSFCESLSDKNIIWSGTETGLLRINIDKKIEERKYFRDNRFGTKNDCIKSVAAYGNKYLFLGTDNGLYLFDTESQRIVQEWFKDIGNKNAIGGNIISLVKVVNNSLWVCTDNKVSIFSLESLGVKWVDSFRWADGNKGEFSSTIRAVVKDSLENIWIGTNNGLYKTQKGILTGEYSRKNAGLSFDQVSSLLFKEDKLWIGTAHGLNYYDYHEKTIKRVIFENFHSDFQYINGLVSADGEDLWAIAMNGLYRISGTKNKKDIHYRIQHFSNPILKNVVPSIIYIDHLNVIWVGTYSGELLKLGSDRKELIAVDYQGDIKKGNRPVRSVCITDSILWVGRDDGLFSVNLIDNKMVSYPVRDDEFLLGMIAPDQEDKDVLWLLSSNAVIRFSQRNGEYRRIALFDYFCNITLSGINTGFVDMEGVIYYGGNNGYICFNPAQVNVENDNVHIVFSRLHINNEIIRPNRVYNEHVILTQSISTAKEFSLVEGFNNINIEFALLDYANMGLHTCRYTLDGYFNTWIELNDDNRIALNNLPIGQYTLRVQVSTISGNIHEASIIINILPPWWKTTLAKLVYILICIGAVYWFLRLLWTRLKWKQEFQLERSTRELQEQTIQIRLDLLTDISHEFRTPLTLIMSPVNSLIEKIKDESDKEELMLIKKNSERLERMVTQIIDLKDIEINKDRMQLKNGDLPSIIRELMNGFQIAGREKGILVEYHSDCDSKLSLFDSDKVEKIFSNLLYNALKFTSDGGTVEVSVSEVDKNYVISVKDTGIGISEKDLPHIFNRFYQGENNKKISSKGRGIGLMLVKKYVELHDGEISVISKMGAGTEFTVTLPIVVLPEKKAEDISNENTIDLGDDKKTYKILVVDDEKDIRQFLNLHLGPNFKVILADNGREALHKIKEKLPDLIITDWMMPEMNGLELCKTLKGDELTSHIPIIILTVKSDEESYYDSVSAGVDDFIKKPFSIRMLKAKVRKLLEKQEQQRRYYTELIKTMPYEVVLESHGDKFIRNLTEIIHQNVDNENLDTTLLCQKLQLSHQCIYRKLKTLTGMTIPEYIRMIRLKKAEQLLLTTDYSITELMYHIGFSSRSHFFKCFTKQYGVSPDKYRTQKE